jgi:hypothetical protein
MKRKTLYGIYLKQVILPIFPYTIVLIEYYFIDLFNDFLDSPYYCMHKIEVYKIGSLQLIDILHDRQLLTLFADVSLFSTIYWEDNSLVF